MIGTFYFSLAQEDGRPVDHSGTWHVRISRAPLKPSVKGERTSRVNEWCDPVKFRTYVLAGLPEIDFDVRFTKPNYMITEGRVAVWIFFLLAGC